VRAAIAVLLGTLALGAAVQPPAVPEAVQEKDAQSQAVIVVVGVGGTREYAEQFARSAALWQEACSKGQARFVGIGLDDTDAPSDRTKLQEFLSIESKQTDATLWLVLIGHGTFDGRTAKFNLRGSDVSADDLAQWLEPIRRPVAVINTASSSAPFLTKLSSAGRVVITATKSGFEQNYARFGQYLAEAIAEPQADLDKDGQTSLLEAFLTASHRTAEFYSAAGRLATEHALLDDNGDGLGTRADWFRGIRPVQRPADNAALDGYRAGQFHLLRSDTESKMPPDMRAERDRLELEVMKLRDTKQALPEDDYYVKLEALLSQIAHIYEQAYKANDAL